MSQTFDVMQGEARTVGITIGDGLGGPLNLTGRTVTMLLRGLTVVRKTGTVAAPLTGVATFSLVQADTLRAGEYVWDVWVMPERWHVASGRCLIREAMQP